MTRAALALLLLASGPLLADGLSYRFRTTLQGVLPRERHGSVWLDGRRARVELVTEAGRVATLRDPAAKDVCTNLDLERQTYYVVPCDSALASAEGLWPSSTSAVLRAPGGAKEAPRRSPPRLEESDRGAADEIAGFPTHRFSWTASWTESLKIGPDTVRVEISKTFEVWTSDRVRQEAFRYGHADELLAAPEELRARIEERLATAGFPMRLVVRSTRKFDRGEPATETLTTEIEEVRAASPEPSLFETPKTFRFEKPVIGIPTR